MSRLIDRGAVFAGWVGVGVAVVLVMAFGLVIPIQPVVFLLALPAGVLMGWYANVRSQRARPRWRAIANSIWAGAITGIALAAFYVGVRLLFVYADAGYPDFNQPDPLTCDPVPPLCAMGPDCTYQRYLKEGRGPELAQAGITDSASFARYIVSEQVSFGALLVGLTVAGAAAAGIWRAVTPPAD